MPAIASARYVIVVNGNKEGEEKRTYTEYSDRGNTFSFSASTTPESEDFVRGGKYNAPVLDFLKKSGSYYYIGIMPDAELSEVIAQHKTLYNLNLNSESMKTTILIIFLGISN